VWPIQIHTAQQPLHCCNYVVSGYLYDTVAQQGNTVLCIMLITTGKHLQPL